MPEKPDPPRGALPARQRIVGDLGLGDEGAGLQPIRLEAADVAPSAPEGTDLEEAPPRREDATVSIVLELNVAYPGGLEVVTRDLFALFAEQVPDAYPLPDDRAQEGQPSGLRRISSRLYQCAISRAQLARLMAANAEREARPKGSAIIFKAWADYALYPHIDRSARTVKADAARRAYSATGRSIVWAVMDSGIDATHPHFQFLSLHEEDERAAAARPPGEVKGTSPTFGRHRDFTHLVYEGTGQRYEALADTVGHGTHVAAIIAGRCEEHVKPFVAGSYSTVSSYADPTAETQFELREPHVVLRGMAPDCDLVSLKVLADLGGGDTRTSSVAMITAIDYIINEVNVARGPLQIHGVNISLGTDWFANVYAAGQSPLCRAISDLVSSGVIVVISAGNSGMDTDGRFPMARMGSITEPGHTAEAITVGSTHRDSPHSFGITFDSSKGPTMDGRRKPDVVAPGEWIASAATGALREGAGLGKAALRARGVNVRTSRTCDPDATYAEMSGTSMAAPHVSGVIAAFLSARPEFIGRPAEVKELLCESATDLGREGYAQGHGLVDLMRMLADS